MVRKMFKHVLQVLPAMQSGGAEQSAIELAEHLSEQGIRSSIASSGGQLLSKLRALGIDHYSLPLNSKNPVQFLRNAKRLERLIEEEGVDLLHVRSRAPAWSVYLASKACRIPYISTFHGFYGHQNALKRFYNSAMLRGQACIAVSEFIKEHIHDTYPWATHIVQINRGVDTQFYDPEKINDGEKEDVPNKPFTLLMPGRFSELKNHALLLGALEQMPEANLKMIFVGSSTGKEHYYNALVEKASKLHQTIEFFNGHQDLRPFYKSADIVVSASRKPESFGRTVIEAQAMGCLVLAPDQGANRSIIAPQLHPGLFQTNNAESLAAQLRSLMAIPRKERETLGRLARFFVQAHFERLQMTQKTLELYQQLWQDSTKLHGR
jgi:glycosyltransferase involved in cell wall biosynthesis